MSWLKFVVAPILEFLGLGLRLSPVSIFRSFLLGIVPTWVLSAIFSFQTRFDALPACLFLPINLRFNTVALKISPSFRAGHQLRQRLDPCPSMSTPDSQIPLMKHIFHIRFPPKIRDRSDPPTEWSWLRDSPGVSLISPCWIAQRRACRGSLGWREIQSRVEIIWRNHGLW